MYRAGDMSFFWPMKPKTDPGVLGRLGRLLHWIFLACAAFLIGLNAYPWLAGTDTSGEAPVWTILGAIIFLLGRGVRYVLAGE
jgi:hypothetical protein